MTRAATTREDPREAVPYPPEPWDLRGHMTILLWRVPSDLVAERIPQGTRPLSLGGSSILGTAWVAYEPGSMVAYDELLSAVHVWHGRALRQTVTDIWVDNPVSVAGGRALWAIPKDLARFPVLDGSVFAAGEADPAGHADVHAAYRPLVRLPVRVRVGWSMVHQGVHGHVVSRTAVSGRLSIGRGSMAVRPDGHLGFLTGRRPFAALQLTDMHVRQGCG